MENHWKRSRVHPEVEVNLTLKKVRYHLSHHPLSEFRQGGMSGYASTSVHAKADSSSVVWSNRSA